MAVWEGTDDKLYAKRYVSGAWSQLTDLVSNDLTPVGVASVNPQIAILGDGDALLIWEEKNVKSVTVKLWSRRYSKQTQRWSNTSEVVNRDATIYASTVIAMPKLISNTAGDAAVVWWQNLAADSVTVGVFVETSDYSKWYRRVLAAGQWDSTPSLSSLYTYYVPYDLSTALSNTGTLVIGDRGSDWSTFSSAQICVAPKVGASWTDFSYPPSGLVNDVQYDGGGWVNLYDPRNLALGFRKDGMLVVTWLQDSFDSSQYASVARQTASTYDLGNPNGLGLQKQEFIDGNSNPFSSSDFIPTIVPVANGFVAAKIGNAYFRFNIDNVWGQRFEIGTITDYAAIGVDGRGNVIMVTQPPKDTTVTGGRRILAMGISQTNLQVGSATGEITQPAVAVAASGDALAIWKDKSGLLFSSLFH
ncbi:MAG: hypothetical protein AABY83_08805 [Pseudomonadota bacterium]